MTTSTIAPFRVLLYSHDSFGLGQTLVKQGFGHGVEQIDDNVDRQNPDHHFNRRIETGPAAN